jgi:curved DNA-binding protein
MNATDHYATLGVAHLAPQAEIKRAYRKLARKYHPDVSTEPGALAQFQAVAAAHEALIDPERRASYDAELRAAAAPRNPAPRRRRPAAAQDGEPDEASRQAFHDFFEAVRARAQAAQAEPAAHRGADEHGSLSLTLRDAYREHTQQLHLEVHGLDAEGRPYSQRRQLSVKVPRGMGEGQRLRLKGQGAPGHGGGAAGDLYLDVAYTSEPPFRLSGRDVSVDLTLAPWEAALGTEIQLPTPEGPVALTVPAGSGAGRQLRLKGRGLPGHPPGDLFAVLAITVPPPTSAAQREAYQALAQAFAPAFTQTAAP